ncbi:unnamed protein product, partial [Iphiclides podalirius]
MAPAKVLYKSRYFVEIAREYERHRVPSGTFGGGRKFVRSNSGRVGPSATFPRGGGVGIIRCAGARDGIPPRPPSPLTPSKKRGHRLGIGRAPPRSAATARRPATPRRPRNGTRVSRSAVYLGQMPASPDRARIAPLRDGRLNGPAIGMHAGCGAATPRCALNNLRGRRQAPRGECRGRPLAIASPRADAADLDRGGRAQKTCPRRIKSSRATCPREVCL